MDARTVGSVLGGRLVPPRHMTVRLPIVTLATGGGWEAIVAVTVWLLSLFVYGTLAMLAIGILVAVAAVPVVLLGALVSWATR